MSGFVEVNESLFGPRLVKGRCGCRDFGKTFVFVESSSAMTRSIRNPALCVQGDYETVAGGGSESESQERGEYLA